MVLEPMHWRYNVDLFLATCSHLDEFIYHTVSVPRKKKELGWAIPTVRKLMGRLQDIVDIYNKV